MEFRSFDDVVESYEINVEYAAATPTVTVSGIGMELSVPTPAAIGWGIWWENGGLLISCVGIPAPLGVGEIGGVMAGRSSVEFHRSQAPVLGSGHATRSRSKVIPRPRGTGGDFRGRGRSKALRVVHGHVQNRPLQHNKQ